MLKIEKSKKIRRMLATILVATILLSCLTSCEKKPIYDDEAIAAAIALEYDGLMEYMEGSRDFSRLENYLLHWAGANKLNASHDKYNTVIISKKAAEGHKEAPSTIIQCDVSMETLASDLMAVATQLYVLKNSEENGFFRVLITPKVGNDFIGAKKVPLTYLKGDNLINLNNFTPDKPNKVIMGSAGSCEYCFEKPITWEAPKFELAYEISIKGILGGAVGLPSGKTPNPIKQIGDLLASYQTAGILFELASFNGGESVDTYPDEATAVVLINSNNLASFTKRFEKNKERFEDKYLKDNPELTYTLTPVEIPDKVVSVKDATDIVSLTYTLINGTYNKTDEKTVTAASNLGVVSTSTGNFIAKVSGRSTDVELLEEISGVFEITANLCSVCTKKENDFPAWATPSQSAIVTDISEKIETIVGKKAKKPTLTMTKTSCSVIHERNPDVNIISLGIDPEKLYYTAEILLEYLKK